MLTEALAIARTQAETSKAQAAAAEQSAAAAREAAALAREAAHAMVEVLGQLSGKRARREGLPQ
jgi:membrane protein involved in colicin uptake